MRRHLFQAMCAVVLLIGPSMTVSTARDFGVMDAAASSTTSTPSMPPMARGGMVDDASCVSGPICVALGWNHHGNTSYIWAERWRNGLWTRLATPLHGAADDGEPVIACVTSTWCMATGSTGLNPRNQPISNVLNDGRWTSVAVPTPEGATDFSLFKLACRTSKWCIGVGTYVANKPNYSDATFLVSEVWNGTTWRIVPIFSPRTYAPQVDPGMSPGGEHPTAAPQQLSCVSTTFCIVAGFWAGVFVEEWNGQRWSQVVAPNETASLKGSSEFSGGACATTTYCVATGGYEIANGKWRPLLEVWRGQQWRIAALPPLPTSDEHGLGFRFTQVECASSDECLAFEDPGFITNEINGLRWNGRSWSYVATGGTTRPTFLCLTKRDCIFVE